jgi:nucleolin
MLVLVSILCIIIFQQGHDQWGQRAYDDLSHTQGKGFRHEKTKKKRGSYSGGTINTQANSIKFDSDD